MAETAKRAWYKRRWVRWTLFGVGGAVVLLLLIVLLLPTLLSSGPGTRFVVSRINATIPGTLDIGDLSLGWFGGQEVAQLRLLDPDGQLVAEVERIALADVGLLGLATGSRDLGQIAVERPWFDVVQDEQGLTNLERALGMTPAAEPAQREPGEQPGDRPGDGPAGEEPGLVPADLSVAVLVTDGEVRYRAPGLEPVKATLPQVALEMPSPQLVTFDVQTLLEQGGDRGTIRAEGRLEKLFDAAGRLDLEGADVRADARVADLPVPLIDRLAAMGDKSLALLLGPKLTAEASANGTINDMTIRLVADAANAAADLQARLTPEALRTSQPGVARLTLGPEAFAQWTGSPATLLQPVTLRVELADLVAPLRDGQPALPETAATVSLTMDDAPLDVPGFGRVAIRGTSARAALQPGSATLAADTTIAQEASAGTLALRAAASDLFNLAGEVDPQGATLDATLTASDLPLDVIDRIAGLDGQLADLLGPTLQVRALAKGRMDDLDASLTAESRNLAADLAVAATPQRITGRGEGGVGTVRLTIPADLASRYLAPAADTDPTAPAPAVREPVTLTLSIPALSVPMIDGAPQPMQTSLTADLAVAPTSLDVPDVGLVRLSDMAARIETPGLGERLRGTATAVTQTGNQQGRIALDLTATDLLDAEQALAMDRARLDATVTATDLPVGVVDQLAGQEGLLPALLGPTLQIDASAKGQLDDLAATVRARAQHLDADLALVATPTAIAGRDGGAGTVRLTVTPAAARQLQGGGDETIVPAAPMRLSLQLPAFAVPMQDGAPQLAGARLGAQLALEPVTLQVPQVGPVALRSMVATLQSDRLADGLTVEANADTVMADRPGSLAATANITDLVSADGALAAEAYTARYTLTARDLPAIALLDTMLQQEGLLVAAAGPTVTADASGTWQAASAGGPIKATLVAGANRLELDGLLEAERVAIDQAAAAFVVTPELFARIMTPPAPEGAAAAAPSPAVTLARPAALKLAIEQANLPLDMNPAQTSLTAQLEAEPFVFQPAGAEAPITLANLALGISAPALNQPIRLTARGDLPAPPGTAAAAPAEQQAGLRSTSTLNLAFTDAGDLNLDATRITTETTVSRFPVALIDQFAQAEVRLVPVLGPVASLQLTGRYPGEVRLQAQSPTAQASVTGLVLPEQLSQARIDRGEEPQIVLDLREDLAAQLWITPEMVAELIGRMHPMFQDAVASESPVRLTVSKDSGLIPLTGLDLAKLRLEGVLDAGKVRMRRGGWLEETVSVITGQVKQAIGLRAAPDRDVQVETYIATFTPLAFSLKNGILDMPETWVTSEDLAIGFVGSVDLNDAAAPKIRQMVMGILQASLVVEAPALGRVLQADQIAELPMSGALSEPTIDYSTLAADLAGSGLVQTARERGGEAGAILGGIVEGIGQGIRKKRARESGVSWSPPDPARALIARARKLGEKPAPQQQQQQQPAQPAPKPADEKKPATPQDLLRDLLGQ